MNAIHVIHPGAPEPPTHEAEAANEVPLTTGLPVALPDDAARILNDARLQVDRAIRSVLFLQTQLADQNEQIGALQEVIRQQQLQLVAVRTREERTQLAQSTTVLTEVLDQVEGRQAQETII